MPKIMVHVSSTVASDIHRGLSSERASGDLEAPHEASGWPVGWGHVEQTLAPDGAEAEALVLMAEPALAGQDVEAWPVAVLHMTGDDPDEVLCVAEQEDFVDLADETDLFRWHATGEAWAAALDRLVPDHVHRYTSIGSRGEAEHLIKEVRENYLRSTGCLDVGQ